MHPHRTYTTAHAIKYLNPQPHNECLHNASYYQLIYTPRASVDIIFVLRFFTPRALVDIILVLRFLTPRALVNIILIVRFLVIHLDGNIVMVVLRNIPSTP